MTTAPKAAPASPPRDLSVFLNCPFDPPYGPLLDALIFTTLCCGFWPRSAIETNRADIPRRDRLWSALLGSKYSIHDLSRCQGEGALNLARFNMPFEFGIAYGHERHNPDPHVWLALLDERDESSRSLSDLLGYDLPKHNGRVESLVLPVLLWLNDRDEAIGDLKFPQVVEALGEFGAAIAEERLQWEGELTWKMRLGIARRYLPKSV